jgi:hypothetical protein
MTKIAGSGSISQRHGSADPDPYPDPHQNCAWIRKIASNIQSSNLKIPEPMVIYWNRKWKLLSRNLFFPRVLASFVTADMPAQ